MLDYKFQSGIDPETHKCRIHKTRPGICRRYPQEELFSMGGALSEDCGYKMEPVIPFSEVFLTIQEKSTSKKKEPKGISKWIKKTFFE